MTAAELTQIAVGGGTAGFSFAAVFVSVRWCANFVAGRIDRKEEQLGRKEAQLDGATQRLIGQLQAQVDELLEHKNKVEKQLMECMERDIEKERRIAHLEGVLAGFGDARQHAALIVAAEKKSEKDGV